MSFHSQILRFKLLDSSVIVLMITFTARISSNCTPNRRNMFDSKRQECERSKFRQFVMLLRRCRFYFFLLLSPSPRFFPFVIVQLLVKQTRKCTGVNYGRRLVEFEHGKTQQLRFLLLLCSAAHKREIPNANFRLRFRRRINTVKNFTYLSVIKDYLWILLWILEEILLYKGSWNPRVLHGVRNWNKN